MLYGCIILTHQYVTAIMLTCTVVLLMKLVYYCNFLLIGKLDYACPVESYAYTQIKQYCLDPVLVSTDFKRLAESIMLQYNIAPPSTFKQALECFFILITVIDFYL